MSHPEIRRKVKEVIRNEIANFDQFDRNAQQEIGNLPRDLQEDVRHSLQEPAFKDRYVDFLAAYEDAVRSSNITSQNDLLSEDLIRKAEGNLQQRGIEFHYSSTSSDGSKKEIDLKIKSEFLRAIGALITKLTGLF